MAYDEGLAERVRRLLDVQTGVVSAGLVEKKMFGGIAWLLYGNMACGVNGDHLMVRVGPEEYETALTQKHVREMDFTGRPMRGWVIVNAAGISEEADLQAWIRRGLEFAGSLPPK